MPACVLSMVRQNPRNDIPLDMSVFKQILSLPSEGIPLSNLVSKECSSKSKRLSINVQRTRSFVMPLSWQREQKLTFLGSSTKRRILLVRGLPLCRLTVGGSRSCGVTVSMSIGMMPCSYTIRRDPILLSSMHKDSMSIRAIRAALQA